MFCERCGKENEKSAKFCISCGAPLAEKTIVVDENGKQGNTQNELGTNSIVLGLIALFIGNLGIHNFIMGYKKKGLVQVLLSTVGVLVFVGPVVSAIWAFVDAIMLFSGSISQDAHGNILHK